jgi:hypothetical protein
MKWYLKELVNQPLWTPNGAKVPFEDIGGTYGILATADPYLIGELDKAVKTHTGGVIPLTETEYNSWSEKKKALASSLGSSQVRDRESLGPIPFQQLQAIRAAGAAAVVANPVIPGQNLISSPNQAQQQAGQQRVEPLQVPTSFSKPRVGKIPKSAPSPIAPLNAPPPASHVEGT